MIIDDSTFKLLFNKLHTKAINPVHFNYSALFIDAENKQIPVHNVLSINRISNYSSAISDHIFVSLNVIKSDYFKLLSTNRRLLKMQLTRMPNSVTGTPTSINAGITENYNAYLTDNTSEAIETRSGGLDGNYTDDLGELQEIHVQLVEKGLSEFRLYDIGGVYRNIKPITLLQGLLSHPLKAFGEPKTIGYNVTVYPPDNTEIYYQAVIPNGVNLADLPGWVQKKWGVYSTGLGYYLSQGMWFIFPLYDITRYEKSTKRITILNIPQNEMAGLHTSYVKEDDEVYIYATGNTKHIDTVDRLLDSSGTGFRAAKMGNLLDKFCDSKNGSTTIPTGRNAMTVSFEQREGQLDNIKAVDGLFSSNVWEDSSKTIANLGNVIVLQWENSNHYSLYPGMPVRFIYKYRGIPYSLYGILLGIETEIKTPLASITDQRYISNSKLTLYCERADK